MNELKIKRVYGDEVFHRGKAYFKEGRVLTAIRFKDRVFGVVAGTDRYATSVRLDNLISTCTCPVRWNCKHGVALLLQFLSGNYVDGNRIMHHLENAERSELLKILKSLIEGDPMLLLNIQQTRVEPSAELRASIQKQMKEMLQSIKSGYADENFVNTFTKFIKTYGDWMDKDLILCTLESLVKSCEEYGYFYDYYNYYFSEEIIENLCDAFTKKSLETSDFKRLQKIVEEDEYSLLEPFLVRMVTPENAPKLAKFSDHVKELLANAALYVEFLINAGKIEEARRILAESRDLSEKEFFNLYLRINETEALKLAKERRYYSSLMRYYHEMGAHEDVVVTFRSALREKVKLEHSPELYEEVFVSIKSCKPVDSEELLHKLFDICYSSEYYSLCVEIGFELKDLKMLDRLLDKKTDYSFKPDSKLKLLKYLSILDPEKAEKRLKTFAEELIDEKKDSAYESAVECVLTLKEVMGKEEWVEYLKELYKRHYRKDKFWSKMRDKGIKVRKEGDNLIIF